MNRIKAKVHVDKDHDSRVKKAIHKSTKKVETVMQEFKHGALHSGSSKGPKVTNRKQAVAIALSEARKHGEKVSSNPHTPKKRK